MTTFFSLTTAAAVLTLARGSNALVRPGNVGKLPALGWNTWNAFGCDIDATKIMTAANEVVNLGLKDLGYEYINSELPHPASRMYVC